MGLARPLAPPRTSCVVPKSFGVPARRRGERGDWFGDCRGGSLRGRPGSRTAWPM